MPRLLTRRVLLGVAVLVPVLICLGVAVAILRAPPRFGPGFDPNSTRGRARLAQFAGTLRPLARVISLYHAHEGQVPPNLEFVAVVDNPSRNWRPLDEAGRWVADPDSDPPAAWTYLVYGPDSCVLICKLDWDPLLVAHFEKESGWTWSYDPGDGRPVVDLPSFE